MYTVDYFIKKFEAIPENMWCTGNFSYEGRKCANGHCGMDDFFIVNKETEGLIQVFTPLMVIGLMSGVTIIDGGDYSRKAACINDGEARDYHQPTPKARILAALYDIKKMQSNDIDTGAKVKTVYVSVPTTITEQVNHLILS